MIYFTADTHFNHKNIIEFCRPLFDGVEEMNELLVSRWNELIGKNDTVYHLGDFGFGDCSEIIKRLNGKKHLIIGNHEKSALRLKGEFEEIVQMKELSETIGSACYYITLCHYPMRAWNGSHYGTWHLFGHTHGRFDTYGLSFDVGVDTHLYYPWGLPEIASKMAQLKERKTTGDA